MSGEFVPTTNWENKTEELGEDIANFISNYLSERKVGGELNREIFLDGDFWSQEISPKTVASVEIFYIGGVVEKVKITFGPPLAEAFITGKTAKELAKE